MLVLKRCYTDVQATRKYSLLRCDCYIYSFLLKSHPHTYLWTLKLFKFIGMAPHRHRTSSSVYVLARQSILRS